MSVLSGTGAENLASALPRAGERWKRKPGKNMVPTRGTMPSTRGGGDWRVFRDEQRCVDPRHPGSGGRPGVHPTALWIGSGEAGRAPARVARAPARYRGDPGKPFMPIDLRISLFSEKGSFQGLRS